MRKRQVIAGSWRAVALVVLALFISCTGAQSEQAPATIPQATSADILGASPTPFAQPTAAASELAQEVVFIEEPDYDKIIGMMEAGQADLYASGTSDPDRERRINASQVLAYDRSYGLYTELTFNPVGPTFPATGQLNPFHSAAIREAMNWLVDRNHIVEEIYGGLAVPRYLPLNTAFPDYARLADTARALEIRYGHDPGRAGEVIAAEMQKLGATLQDGKWQYQGAPVRLIFLIRVEDERRATGDYVATLLEDVGFTVDRQYKTAAEASPIWIGGDPADGRWHLYTGGWISTTISRDQAGNLNFYYTSRGRPEPLWQAYAPGARLDEVSDILARRDYPTWEDRQRLMGSAQELALQDSVRIWLVDTISVWPRRKEISLAADLAGGISGSALWPYTLHFAAPEPDSRPVTFGTPSILTEPWNPVAGSNWIYDIMIMRATEDSATLPDPFTGLAWPQRVKRAEVILEEGTPVTRTHDWLDLSFVPSIQVPPDAWIDWDAAEQRFITVAQRHPEGLTARTKTVIHYDDDLFSVEWHDGSRMSLGDMVVSFILGLDRAKPESQIFDEAAVPASETFSRHFRGLRIVQEDPLVVEVYSDQIFPDAETIVDSRAGYLFTSVPWHGLALGILAEQNREMAFSSDKADRLEVEWMSYIAGPSLAILNRYNRQALAEGFIPYQNAASQYVSASEAKERYRLLAEWRRVRGHFWVGQGPYYLHSVHPVEKIIVIRKFDRFPDQPDKWLRFTEPRIAEVDVFGPSRVSIGEQAEFKVEITFKGHPYAVKDMDFVRFLVLDARGQLVYVGDAQPVQDGMWQVVLTPQQTADLAVGSSRLEVVAVSKLVSIPSSDRLPFVAISP